MYSPILNRFTSRDPIPEEGQPDILYGRSWVNRNIIAKRNPYTYVENNPMNRPDPSGRQPDEPPKKVEKCEIEVCATDIDATKGFAKHLFIKIVRSVDGKDIPWAYRGGPSGDKLLADCRCKGLVGTKFGQVVTTNGLYNDKFVDFLPPEKENCYKLGVRVSCEDLHKCYVKILERIDKCCIPYAPVPIPGKNDGNSNSVAYWLIERCGPDLGAIGKAIAPGKFQIAVAPGWGVATPECAKKDKE